jgi:hypothetical protein
LTETILTILSPFEWTGPYIPNLPPQLARVAAGFVPMILGMHPELYKAIKLAYGDSNFDVYNLGNNEFLHSENIDGATRSWVYSKIIQHVIDFLNQKKNAD